ncbi:GGDEF domain-containing protein [Actinoplanes sp. NPDC049599]|uniref:GGDEF domain-containing protein n=1 Tax=Actinoplanes sp. NPDC049599 TaxID=3363903 RepID=UPI0037B74F7D
MEAPAYELRDLHGASRAVAYLTLAASPYVLVTACLVPGISALTLTVAFSIGIFMAVIGVVCWRRPAVLPRAFWFLAPPVATMVVAGLNFATHDASTGAQLFYLWPILYTANFLSRRVLYANLVLVFAGDAATVFAVLGTQKGASDWVAMVLAMTMAATVVQSLRIRADRLRDVLEQQAHADHLTGLANRRYFDEALAAAGGWAHRTDGSLALLTIDLDHFKAINDTFGHAEGDRVLRAVADALRRVAGDSGVAARLGGDEFVLLLRMGRRAAVGVADALRAAIADRHDLPGGPPGVSIGLAVLPGDVRTVADLVAASDAALYQAKTSGRGRVSVAGERHNVDRVPSFVPEPRP